MSRELYSHFASMIERVNKVFFDKGKIMYKVDRLPQGYCFNVIPYGKEMVNRIDLPSGSQGGVTKTKRVLL
jgi:hypothetical protein